jgi:hypothetical protein
MCNVGFINVMSNAIISNVARIKFSLSKVVINNAIKSIVVVSSEND